MKTTTCRGRRIVGQGLAGMVAMMTALIFRGLSFAAGDKLRILRLLPGSTFPLPAFSLIEVDPPSYRLSMPR
jgi:hypothetical protein